MQLDRSLIIISDVEKRRFSTISDVSDNFRHQDARIALPCVFGVSADGAHFGVGRNLQPLAGHGYQFFIASHSQKCSLFMSAFVERAGVLGAP